MLLAGVLEDHSESTVEFYPNIALSPLLSSAIGCAISILRAKETVKTQCP